MMIIINHQMKSRNGKMHSYPFNYINEIHNYWNHAITATQPNRSESAFGGGVDAK